MGANRGVIGARYLIGLTGNIATGKSAVARMLSDLGATVIDAAVRGAGRGLRA